MNTASMIFLLVGVIAIVAVLLSSFLRSRKRDNPAEVARTERATHQLYEREDAAEHAREDRVER
jgi:FtsZ-interacting cell division protein ZipA